MTRVIGLAGISVERTQSIWNRSVQPTVPGVSYVNTGLCAAASVGQGSRRGSGLVLCQDRTDLRFGGSLALPVGTIPRSEDLPPIAGGEPGGGTVTVAQSRSGACRKRGHRAGTGFCSERLLIVSTNPKATSRNATTTAVPNGICATPSTSTVPTAIIEPPSTQ